MTTNANAGRRKAPASTVGKQVKSIPAPQEQNDNGVLTRLLGYMIKGDSAGKFTWAVVIRIAGLFALILIPYLSAQALNVASTPAAQDGTLAGQLARWSLLAIVAGIVSLVLSFFADRMFAELATHALNKLQKDLFGTLQTLSVSFFDRNPVGNLISRVSNDSEAVAAFYESAVSQAIRSVVQLLLVTVIIFWMNWQLAIAALIIVPVLLLLVNIIQRIATPAYTKMQEELGDLTSFQEETISGHKTIINSRRGEWADDENSKLAAGVFDVGSKAPSLLLCRRR